MSLRALARRWRSGARGARARRRPPRAAPTCAEGPQTVGSEIIGTPCADTIRAAAQRHDRVRRRRGRRPLRPARQRQPLRRRRGEIASTAASATIASAAGPATTGSPAASAPTPSTAKPATTSPAATRRSTASATPAAAPTPQLRHRRDPRLPEPGAVFDDAGFPRSVGARRLRRPRRRLRQQRPGSVGRRRRRTALAGDDFGNFETVIGTPFADYIVGTADAETIYGGGGADLIGRRRRRRRLRRRRGRRLHGRRPARNASPPPPRVDAPEPRARSRPAQMAPQAGIGPRPLPVGRAAAPTPSSPPTAAGPGHLHRRRGSPAGVHSRVTEAPDSVLLAGLAGDDSADRRRLPRDDLRGPARRRRRRRPHRRRHRRRRRRRRRERHRRSPAPATTPCPTTAAPTNSTPGRGEDLFISNSVCDGDSLKGGGDRDNANWANFGSAVAIDLATHGGTGGRRRPARAARAAR